LFFCVVVHSGLARGNSLKDIRVELWNHLLLLAGDWANASDVLVAEGLWLRALGQVWHVALLEFLLVFWDIKLDLKRTQKL
jgi:hypothetical protein